MRCEQFDDRLQALLDERRDPQSDTELIAHARDCADCGEWLRAQQSMLTGLQLARQPAKLEPAFGQQTRLPSERNNGSRQTAGRSGSWTQFASALSLAIVAGLWSLFGTESEVTSVTESAPSPVLSPALTAVESIDVPEVQSLDHIANERVDLKGLAVNLNDNLPELNWQLDLTPAKNVKVNQLSGAFQPLQSSLNTAYDLIRVALPNPEQPATDPATDATVL